MNVSKERTTKMESTEMVTMASALAYKGLNESAREADFVASSGVIDAHGDIVDQPSIDLSAFNTNPVVLWAHDSRALPLGTCTAVGLKGQPPRLECTVRFAKHEQAEQVWQLVRDRVVRGVSIGFVPRDGKHELRDGKNVFVWYGAQIREISLTPTPANPDCLAKMKAKALASRNDRPVATGETSDLLREFQLAAGMITNDTDADFERYIAESDKATLLERALAGADVPGADIARRIVAAQRKDDLADLLSEVMS